MIPKVQSLSASVEIITAIANDINFEDIFSYQFLNYLLTEVMFSIVNRSSSASPNILKVVEKAKDIGVATIGFTGFDGSVQNAVDISLHVSVDNYGIVEDIHHSLMHILAQFN